MTTPQTQPPADIGEMVERLADTCNDWDGSPLHDNESTRIEIQAGDLRALLTDRDDLVRGMRKIADHLSE